MASWTAGIPLGVTDQGDREIPSNRIVPGSQGLGCLLIHGLTGGTHDMQPLAAALVAANFPVFLVQLPGHGSTVTELARCSWPQWYAAARHGLEELLSLGHPIAAVGLSMGSLLALKLAREAPTHVSCLVALSCALELRPLWFSVAGPLLCSLDRLERGYPIVQRVLERVILPKGSADIADEGARRSNRSYQEIPLRALVQLSSLQHEVRVRLHEVLQPALIIHGAKDRTCPPRNADILCRNLGSKHIRKVILQESSHVVTVDRERELVASEVVAFLHRSVRP